MAAARKSARERKRQEEIDGPLELTSAEDPEDLFELGYVLGQGAYGVVYKALDRRDGQFVAVKILDVDAGLSELRKEIKILETCKTEFVVGYKGTYGKGDKTWIVMEFCDGGSLSDLMGIRQQTLTMAQIAVVMRQTIQGLHYLHTLKPRIMHRDVKAANILLTMDGVTKLADFGVSAQLKRTIDKRRTRIGTPYWMAPEVLKGVEYDLKADIWSLGILAVELATGDPPFAEASIMRAVLLIPRSEPYRIPEDADVDPNYRDFVHTCLQKDPAGRPSCAELLQHPYVANAIDRKVMATLAEESIAAIEDYRVQPRTDDTQELPATERVDTATTELSTTVDLNTTILEDVPASRQNHEYMNQFTD